MSYYTVFDQVESLLTTTTTATLASTDLLIVHNAASGRKFATTVGALGPLGGSVTGAVASQATTLTTATNITPSGFTLLKSTGASTSAWLLTDPTAVGQYKTIFCNSTTTSTNWSVTTVGASIQCTGGTSNNQIAFGSTATGAMVNFGTAVTMVSLPGVAASGVSTTWLVLNAQRNPTGSSTGAWTGGVIFTAV